MRRTDPVRKRLREARRQTAQWLQIVSRGIGDCLKGECYNTDEVRGLIERVNGELVLAVEAAERAEKAYEPYWGSRRRRVTIRPRKKVRVPKKIVKKTK